MNGRLSPKLFFVVAWRSRDEAYPDPDPGLSSLVFSTMATAAQRPSFAYEQKRTKSTDVVSIYYRVVHLVADNLLLTLKYVRMAMALELHGKSAANPSYS